MGCNVKNESLLTNIVNIFHNESYNYDYLYRYVQITELKSLLENRLIRFTSPSLWTDVDKYETYFEKWWLDRDNLEKWFDVFTNIDIIRKVIEWSDFRNVMIPFVAEYMMCITCLMPKTYCYCLTEDWYKSKNEHHDKWGKNILICFKRDFWKKLSMNNLKVEFNGDYLFADIFPMHYIDDIDEFLKQCFVLLGENEKIDKIINKGQFLKCKSYIHEKEVRIKLQYHFLDLLPNDSFDDLYSMLQESDNKDDIINICANYLSTISQRYLEKIQQIPNIDEVGYLYLNLPNELVISDIIECIDLSTNISDEEKKEVIKLANRERIQIRENVF